MSEVPLERVAALTACPAEQGWTGKLRSSLSKNVALLLLVCSVPPSIILSGMNTPHADWPLVNPTPLCSHTQYF